MSGFDLSERVAVVTGGNAGIGLGIAQGLGEAGARVMICGRRDAAMLPLLIRSDQRDAMLTASLSTSPKEINCAHSLRTRERPSVPSTSSSITPEFFAAANQRHLNLQIGRQYSIPISVRSCMPVNSRFQIWRQVVTEAGKAR